MEKSLTTGGSHDPFLPKVLHSIRHADEIEFGVAFIKSSGLDLIFQALSDALTIRNAQLTILTSDYLDVTDPEALRRLMLLSERGANVHLFQVSGLQGFHLKTYIFTRNHEGEIIEGSAFIGSSNISKSALTDAIEWNYRVECNDMSDQNCQSFKEIRNEYKSLLEHPHVVPLGYDWIDRYEKRRKIQYLPVAPGSNEPEPIIPEPNSVQSDALKALVDTRAAGYIRGLVVMATGLGKTYLAAFDSAQINAKRILFVAHREEILLQAEATFQRIHKGAKVGKYTGTKKEFEADLMFASIQTLGQDSHLLKFPPDYFDYLIVDEFHHAAASTYRRLLTYFQPRFLLGLTATPERTDQSDILTLCDDNLVFSSDLFDGVKKDLLCPFSYFGIFDKSVDYENIPWRNGRFDPESLSNKLATLARARHALLHWHDKAHGRTLAFCVSKKHAQFMAEQFQKKDIKAAAVFGGSDMDRSEALEKLEQGKLQVIFSVDLFSEGVDIPALDTVMMLRPTESKVLFLQQLGRGLRTFPGKERLVVLDFIGNHRAFLNKPQALFGVRGNYRELAKFAQQVKEGKLDLPPGCYVNYDLEIIDFLSGLGGDRPSREYQTLKDSLNRRPTLTEYYHCGASLQNLRAQYGQWWGLVEDEGDLEKNEEKCFDSHGDFMREIEVTAMNKSFKMVLLETLLENDGFQNPLKIGSLAESALNIFRRRRHFISDIRADLRDIDHINEREWTSYWNKNPVKAWLDGSNQRRAKPWFVISDGHFLPTFSIEKNTLNAFHEMVQELVDYRFCTYKQRLNENDIQGRNLKSHPDPNNDSYAELPYFPNLRIACGYFREGRADVNEYRRIGRTHGLLDPARHFIARAIGDSMSGGKNPVYDGDYLLLERLDADHAGSITGSTIVIERQDVSGDDQYLLRTVTKTSDGKYILKATNPSYPELVAEEDMRTLARLRAILDPLEISVGQEFMREDIPPLFGENYSPGNWNSGHVVLNDKKIHVLLVTLNKQGKLPEYRYHDYFIDESRFHWQSQNSTTPENKRGKELVEHEKLGISIHLFVRDHKLSMGKASPFQYYGAVIYQSHEGSAPMSVIWKLSQRGT
ncbi:MAG: DUF3427 domain-containing protein [Candidatus Scalindua sp.]